jgi:hypothetical protein
MRQVKILANEEGKGNLKFFCDVTAIKHAFKTNNLNFYMEMRRADLLNDSKHELNRL